MIKRGLCIVLTLTSALLANISSANTPTLAEWAFTDQIIDSTPSNKLQISAISREDIYIYTRWENLEVDFYDVEVIIYDGENSLVGYSNYGFKPDKTVWDSWTRYHFRNGTDKPGNWRFVVMVNKTKVLEEYIYIEP